MTLPVEFDPRWEMECPNQQCPGIDVDGPMYADGLPMVQAHTWLEINGKRCPHCGHEGEPI